MKDRGTASLELALGIGMLVIPAVLAVVSFAPWLEARAFVRSAAAEGARAAVLSADDPAGAAVRAVREMASGRGYENVAVSPCGGACSLERGAVIEVEVSMDVPLLTTPWGDVGGVEATAVHRELVDAYRSLP